MTSEFDRPEEVSQAAELKRLGLEFAQNYAEVFVRNQAGARLLAHWTKVYANKRTPVNAPHTEYAANEAVRAFIEGIHDQIRLAQDPTMR